MLRGIFFQAWGSLTSLKTQTRDPQLKVPPGGLVLRIFTSWKNPSTSAGFEPANIGSRGEYVTPRPPRPTRFSQTLEAISRRNLKLKDSYTYFSVIVFQKGSRKGEGKNDLEYFFKWNGKYEKHQIFSVIKMYEPFQNLDWSILMKDYLL